MSSESGAVMEHRGVRIVDTFAEAFDMRAARVVITAQSPAWARTAAQSLTGFATSVIGCKIEAGIEAELSPEVDTSLEEACSATSSGAASGASAPSSRAPSDASAAKGSSASWAKTEAVKVKQAAAEESEPASHR